MKQFLRRVLLSCALLGGSSLLAQNSLPPTVQYGPPSPPPISAGPVTITNGHLGVAGQRVTWFGVNIDQFCLFGTLNYYANPTPHWALDTTRCATLQAQLDNMVRGGIRACRLHGLTLGGGDASIYDPAGKQTTTRQLSPYSLQALDYFIAQCEQRDIRVLIELEYCRALNPVNDIPSWPCPSFPELFSAPMPKTWQPVGGMFPWAWLDTGLAQLLDEGNTQLLNHINQYTNARLGADPTVMGYEVLNETSFAKSFLTAYPNQPIFQGMLTASQQAYCALMGYTWKGPYTLNKVQIQQWLAWVEGNFFKARVQALRQLTQAPISCGTFFGAASYTMLIGPMSTGDPQTMLSAHFYSRNALTDPNGFLTGLAGQTNARTQFAAVVAGCSWEQNGTQIPLMVTEYNAIAQGVTPPVRDPDSERAQVISAVVQSSIAQDVDALFLYSWGWHTFWPDNSLYRTVGAYDSSDDAVLCKGLQANAAAFHDLSLRPTAYTPMPPTNTAYGAGTGPAYMQYGPLSDPALYSTPASTNLRMSLTWPPVGARLDKPRYHQTLLAP